MCKILDQANVHGLKQPQTTTTTERTTKRVRFGEHNQEFYVEQNITEENKSAVWYNNDDYGMIKLEIGALVRGHQLGVTSNKDVFCFRGLEFLKSGNGSPSRKQRRIRYMKDILFYQTVMMETKNFREQELGKYCTTLSKEATQRAQNLAGLDACEARSVYHESHFIYEKNGQDFKMFSTPSSTLAKPCRERSILSSSYQDTNGFVSLGIQGLFSYESFCRILNTAAIFLK